MTALQAQDDKNYGKLFTQNHDLVGGGKHCHHHPRLLLLHREGDGAMSFGEIKSTIWNLAGAGIYWCVGIGAVFHTVLGY